MVLYFVKCVQASEASFVRRSAASMLSGKRPVQAVVCFFFLFTFIYSSGCLYYICISCEVNIMMMFPDQHNILLSACQ